jgi:hypothetical protein
VPSAKLKVPSFKLRDKGDFCDYKKTTAKTFLFCGGKGGQLKVNLLLTSIEVNKHFF